MAEAAQEEPFPARSRTVAGSVKDKATTVTTLSFSDKLLITITQNDKLSLWVHVPLSYSSTGEAAATGLVEDLSLSAKGENVLLPRLSLTATTVLGGTKREDEMVAQTLAVNLATALLVKDPKDGRLLVVGMGLDGAMDKEGFDEVVGLVLDCLST
ncbi:hypothetical protein K470DRAFT_259616 [Piedraia hortae CBS 480.64]|uniref:Proteasome assembly chaperone 3 n=1 Tax=Piedraia hortae CBS 480.64 TaxID=1314780 RepID=A0A6A7BVU9_9PEZI|nr:hypothetical protein K470DRAFT_259616 [Piedraia hortae CBS 480.64]